MTGMITQTYGFSSAGLSLNNAAIVTIFVLSSGRRIENIGFSGYELVI